MTTPQLSALRDALADLRRVDPVELGTGEILRELQQLLAQNEAIVTRAVGAFDLSKEWSVDEARSAAHWLAGMCKIPHAAGARQVRRGAAMPNLPVFEDLWLKGQVTGAHLDLVDRIRRFETEDLLARDEGDLAEMATMESFNRFAWGVRYWEACMAPDVAEANTELQRELRAAELFPECNGMFYGKMTFDPISGAIFNDELRRIDQDFFRQDWAEEEKGGPNAPPRRTAAQRMADALVEMATRSASMAPGARRPEPLFTVLVNYEQLHGRICELAQGMPVSPGSLVPWLDQAYIERAVFGLGTRVEISERARLFTGATRRAIEIRDRECSHPLCEERAERCEVDHVSPFSFGGPTTQENGRLLCGFHNRLAWDKREKRPPPDG